MKLVPKYFLKCNISIIAPFESQLFKNNRYNCKQPNTMNIKKNGSELTSIVQIDRLHFQKTFDTHFIIF